MDTNEKIRQTARQRKEDGQTNRQSEIDKL